VERTFREAAAELERDIGQAAPIGYRGFEAESS
jgi:hypothetical protein